jgi:integrase
MKRLKLVILPRLHDTSEPWFVFYSYRNPKTGQMNRFKISKGFKNLNEKQRRLHAQKLIEEYTKKLKGGWNPFDEEGVIYEDHLQYANIRKVYGKQRKSNLTLRFFLSEFAGELKSRVCKKSYESYQSKIRLFAQWLDIKGIGDNDISAITSDVILEFLDYLFTERHLSGRTIQKYGVNLRQFFKYLIKKKKIYNNPMPEMPRYPNTVDKSARPIRQGDLVKLKQAIINTDPQLWLAIQMQFYCAIRPGNEMLNMRINWIDFDAGTITIPAFENFNGEYEGRAKNRITETVVIPTQFLNELIHVYHLDKYDRDLFLFGPDRMPGERPMGKNTLRVRFNKYRDALGLSKEYKLYSWKHTGGISAHKSGIPIKDIQTQMRHKDLSVTDTYFKRMLPTESEHLRNNYPTI